MEEIVTEIEIDAPPPAVWAVVREFDRYPEWNPSAEAVGVGASSERYEITITLPGSGSRTTVPTVVVDDEPRELRWRGRLYVPGVIASGHRLVLDPLDDGERTRVTNAVTFEGLLAGVVVRRTGDELAASFERMNEALKDRVESEA